MIPIFLTLTVGCYSHLGETNGAYLNNLPPMCAHPVIDLDGRHVRTDELQARMELDGEMSAWTPLCGNAGNQQLRIRGEVYPVPDDVPVELRNHNKSNEMALTVAGLIVGSLAGLLAIAVGAYLSAVSQ